jgi:hypothetical protein
MIAVFTPINLPEESSNGPPELPGLIAAHAHWLFTPSLPQGNLTALKVYEIL